MGTALGVLLAVMSGAHDEWRHGRPLQLLETLQAYPDNFYLTSDPSERGFVHPEDLEALMAKLEDPTPCAAVLQFISAHLPTGKSTVGREAALLVTAFRQGYYPPVPASDLATLHLDRLRAWWDDWRKLPPARDWPSGPGSLEVGVPYAGDFRIEDGWTPVVPLPVPMHHAVRLEFQNLDDFGPLRFGVWKTARLTFRVLRIDVNPIDPPRRWNTTYVAEILRAE
jgi:hypothetical protein